MSGLPNKPQLLPHTLAWYIREAHRRARAARFAQDVENITFLSPLRRFHHRKPPAPFIAPSPDPWEDDDDD